MELINYIIANWDSILICLAGAGALVFIVVKRRWDLLDKVLFALVTKAERELGGKTGQLKLAEVIREFMPQIPGIIRIFLTNDKLVAIIEQAVKSAEKRWESNPAFLGDKGTL